MKRAPLLLVLAGTVAGFVGVLGLHTRPAGLATPGPRAGAGKAGRTPAATPDAAPTGPAGPPAAGGGTVRSALGTQVQFGYGVLEVKVTVLGNRITDVSVPALQVIDPTSQQISEQVFPMLRSEVLAAQSGTIDGISGATYTSTSYAQSLQSALDKLHIK
jgi:FMN-binding domain